MTYIEFFDRIPAENIIACLTHMPDRVIYIGDNAKRMRRNIENYKKVFIARGNNIEFSYRVVSRSNLEQAVTVLSEIVEQFDDCVFDLTGGEELMVFAFGVVYARYPERNIQIHKLNIQNNAIYDCDKDGVTIYHETPSLSVEENIRVYGGELDFGDISGDKTYRWMLTDDFVHDINRIWDVCKVDVRMWNKQVSILAGLDAIGVKEDHELTTVVSRAAFDRYLSSKKIKHGKEQRIIDCLIKYGLLTQFNDEDGVIISYKNEQVKRCLTKAGQALEMKVYVTAKNLLDEQGRPVYDDALNGVVIDWDGQLHDKAQGVYYDTQNEIDVLLMHRVVPVFISCKNGVVNSDELYKLSTVAERFGGNYAKKVLVATSVDRMGEAGKYLRQRAKDMNIRLVENVQDMDDAELMRIIKSLWKN